MPNNNLGFIPETIEKRDKHLGFKPDDLGFIPTKSRKRTAREYILPAWATKYEEKPGERTLLGDIFERPGAAIRSAIRGEGYVKGALRPEEVPTFQEEALTEYYRPTEKITRGKVIGGLGISTVGLLADIATNPAEMLSWLLGARGLKKAPAPMKKPITTKQIIKPIKTTGKIIAKKRPRIMKDRWIVQQGKQGQTITKGIKGALGNAYDDMYRQSGINNIKVNPDKMDDMLMRSNIYELDETGKVINLKDVVLKEIDSLIPGRIDTVQKARLAHDILRSRTPKSYYMGGGRMGKGGLASAKIRQMNTASAIKREIRQAVGKVDPQAAKKLRHLDAFAHKKVYPVIDKMYSIFGRKEIPPTEQIVPIYKGVLGKAAQRETMRGVPKLSKQFKKYVTEDYYKDLGNLLRNSKQLVKDMKKFRTRRAAKWVGAAGGTYLGYRLIGPKVIKSVGGD